MHISYSYFHKYTLQICSIYLFYQYFLGLSIFIQQIFRAVKWRGGWRYCADASAHANTKSHYTYYVEKNPAKHTHSFTNNKDRRRHTNKDCYRSTHKARPRVHNKMVDITLHNYWLYYWHRYSCFELLGRSILRTRCIIRAPDCVTEDNDNHRNNDCNTLYTGRR